ncbi:hypothetical protein BgiMline_023934 [Biomphalaria glabrata]|nr:hypothetical protein BgiMline_007160 [Biomphalaria glabrata]
MTGDEVTGDEVTGDEMTGDEVTGDEVTGDEVTEWAVPVVAVLASTTLVTIVVLMIVCARQYRATRVRRNVPEDEETGTTSYHQHHLPQKSRQEYDTRFVPSGLENDQVLPPFDRVDTPTSSRLPGNRYGRKPWSNLPRNESREYFEMFDLEKSGQSKLSSMDSVDNGEEWTTKYVQETRLYDYGIGDLRNQNNNLTLGEQSNKFQSGLGISPRTPRRDESPVFGTAPRFSKQSAALSFEEVRWSDVQLRQQKVNTIPPVKPKRVFTFDKLQVPYSPSRQRLAGLVSRGFISDVNNQGFSSGIDNQGFSSDFESERSHSKHHKEEGDDNVEGHIQSRLKGNNYNQKLSISPDVQMRNMYGVDDRRHRILKCASYDESKLQVESRQPLYKNTPTRKISTVSEPARELLDIPESSIAKSKWMYPSVDNLDQIDSPYHSDEHVNIVYSGSEQSNTFVTLQTGDFSSTVQENKSTGNVFFIKSEDNKKSHMETSQTDLGAKKSKPDFIFPIISKASKKILEVRNSRKLENAKTFETHSQENPSSRRLSSLSDEDVSKVENVKTVGSASPCSVSQSVPKIILTNESEEDEGDIVQGQGKMSKLKTARGVRRIARANNPFLIEIDQSSSIKSEKFRRASAPSMPSNVDPNVHLVVSQGLTRSSSSELLRAPMLAADVSRTTSSWSELYNLVTHSPEHDSEQRERVKKMIDDRYEALFGNKTPGYALADRLEGRDLWSPRIAKRRHIAKSKAASLERDSSLTHIEEKDSETGNYPSVLASDRRRHSDEPWRPREDVPRISSLSEGNSSTRKMLTHGTDGCDHLQSLSANFDDDSIHFDRSSKMKDFSDMDIARTRNKGQQTMSLNKDKINLSKTVIDAEVSDSEDGARKSRENNEIHGDIGQNSKRDQSLIISNQAHFVKVSEATLTEGRKAEAQVKRLEKFDSSKKELPKDQESDENRNTQKDLCSFDYLHNTNQPKNEKSSLVPRTPEGSTHRFSASSSPESLETNYLPTIHEPELLGLGFGEYADKIVESNENTKTVSKTATRDISENAHAIIHSGQRKATLQNQNQNDDQLSPFRIQSAISSNAPNSIHEQTASPPSKLRKSKVADDEFVQMLKTEERPYFSDGLHDSLPSSKDTSFIDFDTSGEDNQEVDYDVNYFDSLLSSSV